MRSIKILRGTLVSAACLTWLLPAQWLSAAPPAANSPKFQVHDLRLDQRGSLAGQVVNASAEPVKRESLELRQNGELLSAITSDEEGVFSFRNVRPGVYHIGVGKGAVACRVWSQNAAPPIAKDQLLIVSDPQVLRGQQPIRNLLTSPLFVGLVVASAIAIPLAVHNTSDAPSGS